MKTKSILTVAIAMLTAVSSLAQTNVKKRVRCNVRAGQVSFSKTPSGVYATCGRTQFSQACGTVLGNTAVPVSEKNIIKTGYGEHFSQTQCNVCEFGFGSGCLAVFQDSSVGLSHRRDESAKTVLPNSDTVMQTLSFGNVEDASVSHSAVHLAKEQGIPMESSDKMTVEAHGDTYDETASEEKRSVVSIEDGNVVETKSENFSVCSSSNILENGKFHSAIKSSDWSSTDKIDLKAKENVSEISPVKCTVGLQNKQVDNSRTKNIECRIGSVHPEIAVSGKIEHQSIEVGDNSLAKADGSMQLGTVSEYFPSRIGEIMAKILDDSVILGKTDSAKPSQVALMSNQDKSHVFSEMVSLSPDKISKGVMKMPISDDTVGFANGSVQEKVGYSKTIWSETTEAQQQWYDSVVQKVMNSQSPSCIACAIYESRERQNRLCETINTKDIGTAYRMSAVGLKDSNASFEYRYRYDDMEIKKMSRLFGRGSTLWYYFHELEQDGTDDDRKSEINQRITNILNKQQKTAQRKKRVVYVK